MLLPCGEMFMGETEREREMEQEETQGNSYYM